MGAWCHHHNSNTVNLAILQLMVTVHCDRAIGALYNKAQHGAINESREQVLP